MKRRMFLKALLNFDNVSILAILLVGIWVGTNLGMDFLGSATLPAEISGAVVIYLALVLQKLNSKKFFDKVKEKEKRQLLKDLNNKCVELAYESKKYINSAYYARLRKVMDQKNDILNSYYNGEQGYLKGKIVEQTLNLLMTYLKLLINYFKRSRELSAIDITAIANRVTANTRKLNFNTNMNAAEDIKRSIEMDEKVIERIKSEKLELEKISAKLDYMESMVAMFRQQIISSLETEDMLERLETAVNEADALDTVLEERRRNKYNA
ncbi:MAG: hypothetical protein Q8942_06120 [Bacillota bacterium]|nr:hypothetical protein [Bacillota bacterium]